MRFNTRILSITAHTLLSTQYVQILSQTFHCGSKIEITGATYHKKNIYMPQPKPVPSDYYHLFTKFNIWKNIWLERCLMTMLKLIRCDDDLLWVHGRVLCIRLVSRNCVSQVHKIYWGLWWQCWKPNKRYLHQCQNKNSTKICWALTLLFKFRSYFNIIYC